MNDALITEPVDVFIYTVHLLGSGHLRRAAALATAVSNSGMSVRLVSGGRPLALADLASAVKFSQLPSVRARNADFSDLVDENDQPINPRWWAERTSLLQTLWRQSAARVLVTESYPFARRQMRHELLPLLDDACASAARVVCSIRDILQPKSRADRVAEAVEILNSRYQQILVHGDRRVAELSETFSSVDQLQIPIHYTGYIDPSTSRYGSATGSSENFDVVVATGGGAVGARLCKTAVASAAIAGDLSWLVLVGPNMPDREIKQLQAAQNTNLRVQRNRDDYRALLRSARLSVSQAGYNTVVDLVATGSKSVLIPYAANGEREQSIRARKMAALRRAVVVPEDELNADTLLRAAAQAMQLNVAPAAALRTDGAHQSATLIKSWLGSA